MRKQIALCIGNNNYEYMSKLQCAVNDATAINQKLEALNFDTELCLNANAKDMCMALDRFSAKIPGSDVTLFYFAGHGFEYKEHNLLMPIDIPDEEGCYLSVASLKLDDVIRIMREIDSNDSIKTKIIILDACRHRKPSRGGVSNNSFAPISAPKGTIIAFSTSPGQEAIEKDEHGFYTGALIKYIDEPHITIENMLKHVRESVAAISNGRQISWEHTSLMGNYYFNEDSIQNFSYYSDDALQDENYKFLKTNYIGNIVYDLKSCDYNIQNPAMKKVPHIKWEDASANDLFVLGRNIYQSTCKSFEAQGFVNNFAYYTGIPLEARIHLLNGMAFEIYYDKSGLLRDKFKDFMYKEVLSLLNKEEYISCRSFIASKLLKEKCRLIYIPGSEEQFVFYATFKEYLDYNKQTYLHVDSMYYHGNLYFDNKDYDYDCVRYTLKEIEEVMARKILAPVEAVKIESNIDSFNIKEIQLPIELLR